MSDLLNAFNDVGDSGSGYSRPEPVNLYTKDDHTEIPHEPGRLVVRKNKIYVGSYIVPEFKNPDEISKLSKIINAISGKGFILEPRIADDDDFSYLMMSGMKNSEAAASEDMSFKQVKEKYLGYEAHLMWESYNTKLPHITECNIKGKINETHYGYAVNTFSKKPEGVQPNTSGMPLKTFNDMKPSFRSSMANQVRALCGNDVNEKPGLVLVYTLCGAETREEVTKETGYLKFLINLCDDLNINIINLGKAGSIHRLDEYLNDFNKGDTNDESRSEETTSGEEARSEETTTKDRGEETSTEERSEEGNSTTETSSGESSGTNDWV